MIDRTFRPQPDTVCGRPMPTDAEIEAAEQRWREMCRQGSEELLRRIKAVGGSAPA